MDEKVWFRSHVERCLQQVWTEPRVQPDEDGDYPFRWGSALGWVAIDEEEPLLRVWAYAAAGLRRSAKLLGEINDINLRSRSVHVVLSGHYAIVRQAMSAHGVDVESLGQAYGAVGSVAEDIGPMLAAVFGGSTPFPVELLEEDAG